MPRFVTKATASNFHAGPNAKGRLTRVSLLCRSSVIAGDVGNWVASLLFVDKFDLSEFELVERSSACCRPTIEVVRAVRASRKYALSRCSQPLNAGSLNLMSYAETINTGGNAALDGESPQLTCAL